MNFSSSWKSTAIVLCFFALIYFPLFLHLENLPLRIWDEARVAMSAIEMSESGNFLVPHYEGKPDMWSVKPPLMIWLQVFFIKIFGLGELAIRLPSTLAGLFTCLFIFYFCTKHTGNFQLGLIAPLVLVTSNGYIENHATRTGDYDALLTLFTTISSLSFFLFIGKIGRRPDKFLYLTFATLTLAVLTKGVAALLFTPAFLIYAIVRKQVIPTLKNKSFYLALFGFVVISLGYYFLREHYNPGYLKAVEENELGGRYLKTLEGHRFYFWYYFDNLLENRFSAWFILLPLGLIAGLLLKNILLKRLTAFASLLIVFHFLVISTAQTRLEYYDLPLYPLFAVVTAVFIVWLLEAVKNVAAQYDILNYKVLPFAVFLLFFLNPYLKIIDKVYFPEEKSQEQNFYDLSYYLKRGVSGKINLDGFNILYSCYHPHVTFYAKLLEQKNQHVEFNDWRNLVANDKVITHDNDIKNYLENNYHFETLDEWKTVKVYKIIEIKKN